MIDEKKVEAAGRLLARANDGELSVIERAIALDYAYEGVYRAAGNPGEVFEVQALLGIPEGPFMGWSLAHTLERLSAMTGMVTDGSCVSAKAAAVAEALFPEVAKGVVSHE